MNYETSLTEGLFHDTRSPSSKLNVGAASNLRRELMVITHHSSSRLRIVVFDNLTFDNGGEGVYRD